MTYIHKIFHASMVHSLSQPDRKIKINFLDCTVFFFFFVFYRRYAFVREQKFTFPERTSPSEAVGEKKDLIPFSPSRTRRSLRARPVLFPTQSLHPLIALLFLIVHEPLVYGFYKCVLFTGSQLLNGSFIIHIPTSLPAFILLKLFIPMCCNNLV